MKLCRSSTERFCACAYDRQRRNRPTKELRSLQGDLAAAPLIVFTRGENVPWDNVRWGVLWNTQLSSNPDLKCLFFIVSSSQDVSFEGVQTGPCMFHTGGVRYMIIFAIKSNYIFWMWKFSSIVKKVENTDLQFVQYTCDSPADSLHPELTNKRLQKIQLNEWIQWTMFYMFEHLVDSIYIPYRPKVWTHPLKHCVSFNGMAIDIVDSHWRSHHPTQLRFI